MSSSLIDLPAGAPDAGVAVADLPATHPRHGRSLAWLTVGAIGVVFGDIGTSPLYAFREALG